MSAKRIDFEAEGFSFDTLELIGKDGTVYKADPIITAGRFCAFEKAWAAAQFNMSPALLFKTAHDTQKLMQQNNFYDASVKNYMLCEGAGRIVDGNPIYHFELLAILYVAKDEDTSYIDDKIIREKMANLGHYAAQDLFFCVTGAIIPYLKDYEESFQATLQNQKRIIEDLMKGCPTLDTLTDPKKKK